MKSFNVIYVVLSFLLSVFVFGFSNPAYALTDCSSLTADQVLAGIWQSESGLTIGRANDPAALQKASRVSFDQVVYVKDPTTSAQNARWIPTQQCKIPGEKFDPSKGTYGGCTPTSVGIGQTNVMSSANGGLVDRYFGLTYPPGTSEAQKDITRFNALNGNPQAQIALSRQEYNSCLSQCNGDTIGAYSCVQGNPGAGHCSDSTAVAQRLMGILQCVGPGSGVSVDVSSTTITTISCADPKLAQQLKDSYDALTYGTSGSSAGTGGGASTGAKPGIVGATTAIVMAKKPDTLKKSPCFDVNLTKILSISNIMLTLYNVAVAIAINFVMQLINTICQAIVTEINNLLSQLCIPLPQIPGLGGLSGPAQKPCNGIPLIPMATFQPVPLPRSLSQDLFVPQSQIGPKYNTYNFNPGH